MKLIITDIENFNIPVEGEYKIIKPNGDIRHCIGCFGCWVKTPGKCVIHDGYHETGVDMSKCTELIIISRCYYGSVSPFVKMVEDRANSYFHPDFVIRKGEMHHKRRYKNTITLSSHFYGENITDIEKETARELLEANADNYDGVVKGIYFYKFVEELEKTDIWVFSYPLYVDGIPGHLLSCLVQLEEVRIHNPQIHVYGIVNCGFYEGIQAEYALKILQNWCLKTGFIWSGGIGVGGGGVLAMMPQKESGYGPKTPIDKALVELSNAILKKQVRENIYVSVAFPRFLYKMGAQIGWRKMIKANGGKVKDLKKCWDK